jgi:hypothetical protein
VTNKPFSLELRLLLTHTPTADGRLSVTQLLCPLSVKVSSKSVEKKTNEYQTMKQVWVQARREEEAEAEESIESRAAEGGKDRSIGAGTILLRRPAAKLNSSNLTAVIASIHVVYSAVDRDGRKGLLTHVLTKGGASEMRPRQRSAQLDDSR